MVHETRTLLSSLNRVGMSSNCSITIRWEQPFWRLELEALDVKKEKQEQMKKTSFKLKNFSE